MKSISIHGVDDLLMGRLKREAEAAGTSLNRTVKRLLEEAVGMKPRPKGRHRAEFETFLGVWSEEDLNEFRVATEDLERVDQKDWS